MGVCLSFYYLINQKQKFLLVYLVKLVNPIGSEVVDFRNWDLLVLGFLIIFFSDGIYVVEFVKTSKIAEDDFIKI